MYQIYKNTQLTDNITISTKEKIPSVELCLLVYNFLPIGSQIKLLSEKKEIFCNKLLDKWEIIE